LNENLNIVLVFNRNHYGLVGFDIGGEEKKYAGLTANPAGLRR